jgi:hypothetical protein
MGRFHAGRSFFFILTFQLLAAMGKHLDGETDVSKIISNSVAANQRDYNAAPDFDHKERDRTASGTKTYQITMIDGSPYQRLIAINGKPLSSSEEAYEHKKQAQAENGRHSQSEPDRKRRIASYEADRRRDNQMMNQLTVAFDFTLLGEHKLRGFSVWMLKATPKAGYHPPNMETQVLPGMLGELWIDKETYQWVKVTARVIHPVSIEGFLAQVEPGTQFELENEPVGSGVWQPSHFAMRSQAKVLFLINRSSQADETYYDYERSSCCKH